MSKNKQWTNKEKFVIALAAIKNEVTIQELCQRYHVAASQIYAWKKELLERGEEVFTCKSKHVNKTDDGAKQAERLYAKIGQLTVERDFLQRALGKCPRDDDKNW